LVVVDCTLLRREVDIAKREQDDIKKQYDGSIFAELYRMIRDYMLLNESRI
jgi:hypothetical protein